MISMRKIFFVIITVCCLSIVKAQENTLIIEGAKPAFFIAHKVMPKENFYSVGRLYNISPKEVAPFNNLDLAKGLSLGQIIHIPLTASNFSDEKGSDSKEAYIPVYHIVSAKETISKVAGYFSVTPDNLKKWNNLKSLALVKGNKLIIGYLKVSKELSGFASKSIKKTNTEVIVPAIKPSVEVGTSETATVKTESPKVQVPKVEPPVEKPVATVVAKTNKPTIDFNGGTFKSLYDQQTKNKSEVTENGVSGVFKSTSGWQDGKYYCFNNNAAEGTIIKVTNPKTGKSIFAKVLDLIPEIRQNSGLMLQLSNAAAEELGVIDAKFDCTVSYYK